MNGLTQVDKHLKESLRSLNPTALVAAICISALSVLGEKYANYHTLIDQPISVYLRMGVWFIVWLVVSYIAIVAAFYAWNSKRSSNLAKSNNTIWKTTDRQFAVISFSGMLFSRVVWITLHYPGAMRDDTLAQIFQSMGYMQFFTQHPIFDTLVFGAFYKLGELIGEQWAGLYLYLIIQAIISSATFAYVLNYLRKHSIPKRLIIFSLFFLIFARVVYAPLTTMSKDTFNAWSFVLITMYMVELIRTRGVWLNKTSHIIAFIAVSLFCILSKRTMFYVIVLSMVAVAIQLFKHSRRLSLLAAVVVVIPAFVVFCIVNPIFNRVYNPINSTTYVMFSIPVQQLVRTVKDHPNALNDKEIEELSRSFDIGAAMDHYNPVRSDDANRFWKPNANMSVFLRQWARLLFKYPTSYFEAFMCQAGGWFSLNNTIEFNRDLHVLDSQEQMAVWDSFEYTTEREKVYSKFFPCPMNLPESLLHMQMHLIVFR